MNARLASWCGPLAVWLLCAPPAGAGESGAGSPAGGPAATAPADCSWLGEGAPSVVPDVATRLAAYAPTPITADLSHLSVSEREVLRRLIEAARIMDDLFAAQACPCWAEIRARAAALPPPSGEAARAYLEVNVGPWDRRFDREPFLGSWPHPAGANFYPLDLTTAEKTQIQGDQALSGLQTIVRRDAAGRLVAIPYGRFFAGPLGRCASLLREAAALTDNASLRAFLTARADALLSDDAYESDLLWMDVASPVEITIGPYETYEDGLFGYKAAYEAFVTVVDPQESARLERYKQELPWLESRLPIPDADKNPNRGTASPIRVVDVVFTAGDTKAGVQTIAFNLPNDERVREAKGSKKVLLRNLMNAKFEQILVPIGQRLVVADQVDDLSAEAFFLQTLFHEMSHGLGPGRLVLDGRETEVRRELKDTFSALEEAKADLMGYWDIQQLAAKGDFTPRQLQQQMATFLAGLFRSVRFGIGEAHGQANAIEYNWLVEKGGVAFAADTGRFRVDPDKFPGAIESVLSRILTIQARGDYAAAKALIAGYAVMPPDLAGALRGLEGIPVDIRPSFPQAAP